ncbi:MAG: 5-formyltetrahydrofolate cyclo-ligase [Acholeplasmatales bacterium]|nr:5-formyltetrahydrofolate cyclo-ligase [Acholeplasmatales bacterium]
MNKKEARAYALETRKKLDNKSASKTVFDALYISNILNNFDHIGIYYPIGKEIDITCLKDKYPNKTFYLPITKEDLYFSLYDGNLIKGPFNTKEPTGSYINRDKIECFIIPCVAISNTNQRLGYGKGYYDKYLDGYKGIKIGVCYKELSNLKIECNEYDIELDYVFVG